MGRDPDDEPQAAVVPPAAAEQRGAHDCGAGAPPERCHTVIDVALSDVDLSSDASM